LFRRVDPLAVVVDLGVGADDGVGGGQGALGTLDDEFERVVEVAGAAPEEASGVGVAIDGGERDAEFAVDVLRAVPVEEAAVDRVAIGVTADEALAGVAVGVRKALRTELGIGAICGGVGW